jgi:hypothetical protein
MPQSGGGESHASSGRIAGGGPSISPDLDPVKRVRRPPAASAGVRP